MLIKYGKRYKTFSKTKSIVFSKRSIVFIGNALKRSISGFMLSGVILFKIDRTFLLISCKKKSQ